MVDLLELRFDDRLRFPQLAPRKAGTGCHGDCWHKPEFYVSVRMLHVDMHPWLFAREEEQAIRAVANDRGSHPGTVAERTASRINTMAELFSPFSGKDQPAATGMNRTMTKG